MEKTIISRVKNKYDTQENWENNNPVLLKGEIGFVTKDSVVDFKIGDGQKDFKTLSSYQDIIINSEEFNKILDTKADEKLLDDYLLKKDYIAGESGGAIDLSNYLTKNEADQIYATKNIIEMIYPVGSIYITVNELNPSSIFNFGVWEKIEDKFLLGASSNFLVGTEGGEQTHTLTLAEMPAHNHTFIRHQLWSTEDVPEAGVADGYGVTNKSVTVYTDNTSQVGEGIAHNNMPPYLSVYIWKRTQ